MDYELHLGDCLDVLRGMEAGSVDAVITDPPYGTTACKWDSVIPLAPMWAELKRVIKPRGAIVLFAAQPFTSALVMSNAGWFRYEIIWHKTCLTNFFHVKRQPARMHENILVFYGQQPTYNPQMVEGKPYTDTRTKKDRLENYHQRVTQKVDIINQGTRYPGTVALFSNNNSGNVHPTQKPVDLLRYLIRTYTNAGETVLDFTMGSGTTGVAALQEGRRFIGIELDPQYYAIAERRIANAQPPLLLPDAPSAPAPEQAALLGD